MKTHEDYPHPLDYSTEARIDNSNDQRYRSKGRAKVTGITPEARNVHLWTFPRPGSQNVFTVVMCAWYRMM